MIETRNGSGEVLKQQVWGTQYVDELVQVGVNAFGSSDCDRYFWVTQDANFNVLGLFDPEGDLVERYEYTPYGQRTVFSHGYMFADVNSDATARMFIER